MHNFQPSRSPKRKRKREPPLKMEESLKQIPRWYGGYHQEGWVPSDLPIFELAFMFTLTVFAWEIFLDFRQHSRLESRGGVVPDELAVLVKRLDQEALKRAASAKSAKKASDESATTSSSEETKTSPSSSKEGEADNKIEDGKVFEKMSSEAPKFQAYGLSKSSFGLVKSFWSLVQDNSLLFLGLFPFLWDKSSSIAASYGYGDDEIIISLIFVGLQMVMDTIISTPWSLYSTFVVEEKHGFNKTTPRLFFTDMITSLSLTVVIGAPVLYALLRIIKWGGEYFYIYVWAFLFAFSIFFLTIFPVQ
jgi:hypothetical protein